MTHAVTTTGGYVWRRNVEQYAFGQGRLRGTVVGPDDAPKRRRVHLFVEEDFHPSNLRPGFTRPISVTRSDESSGEWEFRELDMTRRYRVEAYDHTGQYDPVIKGGQIPEPMEPQ